MLSNPLNRYRPLLDVLPPAYVFDGEICVLHRDGRPTFTDLLFHRRQPVYVAVDVLVADGKDVRSQPLKERKAILDEVSRRYAIQKSALFFSCRYSMSFASPIWRVSLQKG
jgi:ATP-dependent DNA ligase